MIHLSNISINTLSQLKEFLKEISDQEYSNPIKELSDSSIGQHTRHILEFYSCLIDQSQTENSVNYDNRKRNLKVETSKEQSAAEIELICSKINKISTNQSLPLKGHLGGQDFAIETNTQRELLYALEHAIHHMAIIKIGIKILNKNIYISPTFGVAESTIAHRKCAQ